MYCSTNLTSDNDSGRKELYLKWRTVCMFSYACQFIARKYNLYSNNHNNLYLYFYDLIIMISNDASMEAF
jgi:hypothetical protein